jgi:hypothetical protein
MGHHAFRAYFKSAALRQYEKFSNGESYRRDGRAKPVTKLGGENWFVSEGTHQRKEIIQVVLQLEI